MTIYRCNPFISLSYTGVPPFEYPNEIDERFRILIGENGVHKLLSSWDKISLTSNNLVNLLSSMLQVKPENRISLKHILSHKWTSNGLNIHRNDKKRKLLLGYARDC